MAVTNVTSSVEGSVLTIQIDLSKDSGPTSTGKSIGVATTGGNVTIAVDGGGLYKYGVNLYRAPRTTEELVACNAQALRYMQSDKYAKKQAERLAQNLAV